MCWINLGRVQAIPCFPLLHNLAWEPPCLLTRVLESLPYLIYKSQEVQGWYFQLLCYHFHFLILLKNKLWIMIINESTLEKKWKNVRKKQSARTDQLKEIESGSVKKYSEAKMGSGASVIVSSQVVGNVVLIFIVIFTISFIVFSKSLTIVIIIMSNYHRIHPPVHQIYHYRRHLAADGNCTKNGGSCSGKQGHAGDSKSGDSLLWYWAKAELVMKSTLEASSKASHQIAQQVYTYPAYISKVEPKKKISNISSWTFAGLGAGSLPPPARPLCQQDRLSSARYQTAKVPSVLISSFISHCSNVSDLTFLN